MRSPRLNVWKCYALSFTWGFILLQAVMMPYFQAKGLSLAQVFQLQSVFAFSLLLLDVPTGYFSDLFGRRITLIVAAIFKGLGGTALVVGHGFSEMLAAYVLIGIANSFLSGSDTALLYDSHAEIQGKKPQSARLRGRVYFVGYVSITLAALLGGQLGARSLEVVAIVNAAFAWLSLPIALSIEEPSSAEKRMRRTGHWKNLRTVWRRLFLEDRTLRGLIAVTVIYSLAPTVALYAFQRVWQQRGLGLAWFGAIAALQNITSGLLGISMESVTRRIGSRVTLLLIGLLPLIAFFGASTLVLGLAILASLMLELLRVLIQVVLLDQINSRLSSEYRATANSLMSGCNRLLICITGPLMGWLLQRQGTAMGFTVFGVLYVVAFIVMCLPAIRLLKRERPVEDSALKSVEVSGVAQ